MRQGRDTLLLFESLKHYDGRDPDILHLASLLYRYYNRFDLESNLLRHALSLYAESRYFAERQAWHQVPWFEKLSAREINPAPRDRSNIPKQETLSNLCFVLAADDNYFEFLVECIESIKATTLYNQVDLKILDVGLSHPEYFRDRWKIEVLAPGWPAAVEKIRFFKRYFSPPYAVEVESRSDEGDHDSVLCEDVQYAQAVLNKPFLHELVPGYNYYCWIDSDCWIQDERGLDRLICLAERQGYAFPSGYVPMRTNPDLGTRRVPSDWRDGFINKPNNASSIYCNSSEFQSRWAQFYREAGKKCGFWWGQEEEVASYCMGSSPEIIEFSEILYLYRHFGLPVVKQGESALRNPETLRIIPIIGLGLDKKRYYYPVAEYDELGLSDDDLLNSVKAVGLDIDWSKETPDLFERQKLVSFRFRSHPKKYYDSLIREIVEHSCLSDAQFLDIQEHKNKKIEQLPHDNRLFLTESTRCKSYLDPDEMQSIDLPGDAGKSLGSHEFNALREAQILVRLKEEKIQKLDVGLAEAQAIVRQRSIEIEELRTALKTAQDIVQKKENLEQKLHLGLREAQEIVQKKENLERNLYSGLREAQEIVQKKENVERNLYSGLREAQELVRQRDKKIEQLEAALREAQELAWERQAIIEELKKT